VKRFVITLLVTVVAAVALLIAVEPTAQEPDVPPKQTRPIAAPEPTEGPPGSNLEGIPNAVTPVLYQRALAFIAALPVPPLAVEEEPQAMVEIDKIAAGDPVGGGSYDWDAIAECERGADAGWNDNHGPTYEGRLGFWYGTWDSYRDGEFTDNAGDATREQQIIVAERVAADVGITAWGCWRAG